MLWEGMSLVERGVKWHAAINDIVKRVLTFGPLVGQYKI